MCLLWACLPLRVRADTVDVVVDGLPKKLTPSVQATLDINAEAQRKQTSATRIRRAHAAAPRQIRAALEASGYYRVDVEPTLTHDGRAWQARYRVDRGPALRVAQLDAAVAGPALADTAVIASLPPFPLKQGDRLRHAVYEDGKRAWLEALRAQGYLDAVLTVHRVDVDLDAYTATVRLHLDSGRRYRFGDLAIEPTVVSGALLRRYGAPKPRDPYSTARLLDYQSALADSGYFNSVDVQPGERDPATHSVPVTVQTTPRPGSAYSGGVGFATDSGPRLRAGYDRRYLNDRGHTLGSTLLLSPADSELGAQYRIPLADPRTDQLSFGSSLSHEDTDTRLSDTFKLQTAVTRQLGIGRRSVGVDYLVERFSTGDDRGTSRLLMPSIGWQASRADNALWPRDGWRLDLTLRGALAGLLSDLTFVQARASGKLVRGIAPTQRLIGRLDLGTTWVDGFGDLPASLRFFAGGDQSVRGFDYEKLGPRDSSGDVIGGRQLVVASIEHEWMFAGNFGGALFCDTGNAFDGTHIQLERSVGVGFRWRSPVGAVRVDVARAVSEPGSPLRLHLTVGPDL